MNPEKLPVKPYRIDPELAAEFLNAARRHSERADQQKSYLHGLLQVHERVKK